MSGKLN